VVHVARGYVEITFLRQRSLDAAEHHCRIAVTEIGNYDAKRVRSLNAKRTSQIVRPVIQLFCRIENSLLCLARYRNRRRSVIQNKRESSRGKFQMFRKLLKANAARTPCGAGFFRFVSIAFTRHGKDIRTLIQDKSRGEISENVRTLQLRAKLWAVRKTA